MKAEINKDEHGRICYLAFPELHLYMHLDCKPVKTDEGFDRNYHAIAAVGPGEAVLTVESSYMERAGRIKKLYHKWKKLPLSPEHQNAETVGAFFQAARPHRMHGYSGEWGVYFSYFRAAPELFDSMVRLGMLSEAEAKQCKTSAERLTIIDVDAGPALPEVPTGDERHTRRLLVERDSGSKLPPF